MIKITKKEFFRAQFVLSMEENSRMILENSVAEDLSQVQKANCIPHIYKYPVPQEKDDSRIY